MNDTARLLLWLMALGALVILADRVLGVVREQVKRAA